MATSLLKACLGIGDPVDFCWEYLRGQARWHGVVRLDHLPLAARPAVARLAEEHGLQLVITPTAVGLKLAGE